MANYFLQSQVNTEKPIEEVVEAASRAMRRVGGGITSSGNTLNVMNGVNGVSMAFVSTLNARIEVEKNKDDKYTINASITKTPNVLFWVSLVAGFCILVSWVLNILYLTSDPTPQYQAALDQIHNELDK